MARLHAPQGSGDRCDFITDTGARCNRPAIDHHLEMMRAPDEWPQWPVLPLKRYTGAGTSFADLECGFLVEQPEKEAKFVYLATIFEAKEVMKDPSRQLRYESFEDVYADGWRID